MFTNLFVLYLLFSAATENYTTWIDCLNCGDLTDDKSDEAKNERQKGESFGI